MSKLETIEGIGPAVSEKLAAAGIKSVDSLLQHGATKKGRDEIAAQSGLAAATILRFVNHADLMRIKGIGGEYSELLECSGVDTVPELAHPNAANLTGKMAEVNAAKKLVRSLPTESQVSDWVAQAATLPKVVTH